MKNKSEISVCFVTDENYAKYACTTALSILKNASGSDNLHFYIIHNGLKSKTIKLFSKTVKKARTDFIDVSEYNAKYQNLKQKAQHITKTSYYKFLIADVLKDLNKVIYLDCDIIVQNSLHELFDINVNDYLFGAVEDVGYTYHSKLNDNLKLKFKCINSGVMLINCEKWRNENLSDKLFDTALNDDRIGSDQDQSAFNIVCKDRIKFIDFKWNVQDTFMRFGLEVTNRDDYKKAVEAPDFYSILHYTYISKPWNNMTIPMADDFWKYYMQTQFITFKEISRYIRYKLHEILEPLWQTYSRKAKNKTLEILGLRKKKK